MKPKIESRAKSLRTRGLLAFDRRADLIALISIFVLTVVAGWDLVSGGVVVRNCMAIQEATRSRVRSR